MICPNIFVLNILERTTIYYQTLSGLFYLEPIWLDGRLRSAGENLFRLSVTSKKAAYGQLKSVFGEGFSYKFVDKLGEYNVYEAVPAEPAVVPPSGCSDSRTADEVLRGNLDCYLYDYSFPLAEKTNRNVRTALYRLYLRDSSFTETVDNGLVHFKRIAIRPDVLTS